MFDSQNKLIKKLGSRGSGYMESLIVLGMLHLMIIVIFMLLIVIITECGNLTIMVTTYVATLVWWQGD